MFFAVPSLGKVKGFARSLEGLSCDRAKLGQALKGHENRRIFWIFGGLPKAMALNTFANPIDGVRY